MTDDQKLETIKLTPEQEKSRRTRSVAIAVCIAVLVGLFYAITVIKLGPVGASKPF